MKSASDPRHQHRRSLIKELFAVSFASQETSPEAQAVLTHLEQLDSLISSSAPEWPIDKLNRTDLAILRLASYELLFSDTPPKVVIDEAVELAKEFGAEASPSFVNGVLGSIFTKTGKQIDEPDTTKEETTAPSEAPIESESSSS
jgi:N utilization substance protein B